MGRAPCCDKVGLKKGPWTPEEDQILINFIAKHGHSNWRALPKQSGLLRCGKSCRLRWINYLKPDIKRGNFTREEEDTIIHLHEVMGNRWSAIAARLPGRTDNEIKNVWHTHLKKRLKDYQPKKSEAKNVRKGRGTNNVTTPSTTTNDNSTTSGNSFLETTSFGASDQNQRVTSSGSPQQSSTTSDEFSSGNEVSSVQFSNNVGAIMDVQSFNSSIQETSLEDFPIIDESFWELQDSPLDDGQYYNTTSSSEQLSNIIIDDNGLQFESLLGDQEITSIINNSTEDNGGGIFFDDDNMGFWLDVFVQAGGAPELPEF